METRDVFETQRLRPWSFRGDGGWLRAGRIFSSKTPHCFQRVARVARQLRGGLELPGTRACAVYCDWRHTVATESLAEVVRSLTPQEQDAVRQFIEYLRRRDASFRSPSPFLQAADEFIAQHPELLQRLAQ